MKLEEFQSTKWSGAEEIPPTVSVDELTNQSERTLLYGYTSERATWQVVLLDGKIVRAVWSYGEEANLEEHSTWQNANRLIPNKRLYPERCDFEFCTLLYSKGILLPFTTFRDR